MNINTAQIHARNMRVYKKRQTQKVDFTIKKITLKAKPAKKRPTVRSQIISYSYLIICLIVGSTALTRYIYTFARNIQVQAATPLLSPQGSPTPKPQVIEIETLSIIEPKTEKQKIIAYLVEKFGDHAVEAIAMIRTCENRGFRTDIVSPLNIQRSGRRSYDVGLMQINVDELNTAEQERLKDWKYNIDRGYQKYKASGNKFTAWSCAPTVGQANYLGEK